MGKVLTIIIPSYNVENTLRETVESCLIPDMNLREMIEVLIVNDGSTDGTLQLAEDLEKENSGIIKVWDKKNGGHGSTINVGIDNCEGKYLKVVDGDDLLNTAALNELIKKLINTNVDAVMTNFKQLFMSTNSFKTIKPCTLPYDIEMTFSNISEAYNFPMHSIYIV